MGFVGSHIVARFHAAYPRAQIVVIDKFCYPARFNYIREAWAAGRIELLAGDICDETICHEALSGADLLIHAAAESHVDNSFADSARFMQTNVAGTYALVDTALAVGLPLMIHVSTDEVYGERPHEDVDETGSLKPTNPYSASKAAADLFVMARHRADKLPVMIVRANNMYGVHQFPEKVIPRFICESILGRKLPVQGSGRTLRSFLAAQDFAEALLLLVERGKVGEIYNVGSKDEYSVLDLATMIAAEFNRNVADCCEFVPDRPFNDSRYGIIDEKIKALGWRQTRSLKEDLPELISWYREEIDAFMTFLTSGQRVGTRCLSAAHLDVPRSPTPAEWAARPVAAQVPVAG
jgi:dTDP-glucose 4,6-dehydratase